MNYQGRRTKKCFQQNEKLANQFAEKVLARIKWCEASGEPFPLAAKAAAPTVQAYLEEWLKTYAVHCKPSTAQGYRRWLELYIYPVLGGKRLGEVGRAKVKRLIAELSGKGLKQQTIHNILTPLKESYNHAIDDGIMTTNPVARTGRLTRSREDRRKRLIPLTRVEVETMLHGAKEGAPHLYSLLLCAVRTGMRQGELIALQWSDIDFRGQFIEIRRTWRRGRLSDTKNHKIRRVELSPQLLDHLRELYDTQQLEASMSGNRAPEWVFVTPSRTRYDDSNLRLSFNHVLMRAGIRRVRFHDLRHTYASLMAEAGAPPKYVQEQLGHSSIQVTMDVYSHLFPSGNRNWLKHLDEGRENKDSAPLAHPTLPHHPLWL